MYISILVYNILLRDENINKTSIYPQVRSSRTECRHVPQKLVQKVSEVPVLLYIVQGVKLQYIKLTIDKNRVSLKINIQYRLYVDRVENFITS